MFTILIADDHPLFRAALREVIAGMFGEYEIFEAGTLDEARKVVTEDLDHDLDLILLDLQMPGSNGYSGLIELRNIAPSVPIVVVSAATSKGVIRDSITYGALGFIPKSLSKDEIKEGMERVISGGLYLPPEEIESDAGSVRGGGESFVRVNERFPALTQGELRVLDLLAKGKSNKIIAYELGIRESTVKAHITAILRKLKVHSRTQAVLAARDLEFGKG
ncbi:MAG: response regulator transcription factor [Candidatus Binatia bacterium]